MYLLKADQRPGRRQVLNEDTERGGVMISTWHLGDTLVSNLTLYRAGPRDKVRSLCRDNHVSRVHCQGYYTCRLPGDLAALGNTTVSVHILNTTMTGEEAPVPSHGNGVMTHCRACARRGSDIGSGMSSHDGVLSYEHLEVVKRIMYKANKKYFLLNLNVNKKYVPIYLEWFKVLLKEHIDCNSNSYVKSQPFIFCHGCE